LNPATPGAVDLGAHVPHVEIAFRIRRHIMWIYELAGLIALMSNLLHCC